MYSGSSNHPSVPAGQRVPFNVQDYKDKRAAQLERARRIREERDQRRAPATPEQSQPQEHQRQDVSHKLPANPVDEIPIRGAAMASQQPQQAPPGGVPARRKPTFDSTIPPPSSSDSTSSTNSYGYDSVGSSLGRQVDNRTPIPSAPIVKSEGPRNPRSGETLAVSENDVSGAVVAGILNLEQAGRLWRYLSTKEGRPTSAPLQPPSFSDHMPDPRFRATEVVDPPVKPRSAREQPNDHNNAESETPPQQSRPPRSRKPEWNFDTEVQNDNLSPEPLPVQTHSQRRPPPRPARSSKPDWSSELADSRLESYDDPPTHAQPQRLARGGGVAQPSGAPGFPSTGTLGPSSSADKLSLLKGRVPARAGVPEKPQQYAAGITYEASPFGTSSPSRGAAPPQRREGYKGGLSAYTRPAAEEEYTTGRIIESEEERITKTDRNSQLEVEMYEASNVPMRECHVCGRSFRQDRIGKHTVACEKSSNKKRKVFDMSKQRLDGEALKIARDAKRNQKPEPIHKEGALPKWKQQHLEFQHALKSGRAADDGLAPPPPPVQDTREECPYCGRRFASDVAERHIPKCKNIVHKPKSTFRR
eukprot:GGOE01013748.1.p1 GENE.GGOE01013748.1~~GGOE01013748.1.p1  ORF type:complete len:588 (-),score=51.43 GGOE01013748.1:184-1947(-)